MVLSGIQQHSIYVNRYPWQEANHTDEKSTLDTHPVHKLGRRCCQAHDGHSIHDTPVPSWTARGPVLPKTS